MSPGRHVYLLAYVPIIPYLSTFLSFSHPLHVAPSSPRCVALSSLCYCTSKIPGVDASLTALSSSWSAAASCLHRNLVRRRPSESGPWRGARGETEDPQSPVGAAAGARVLQAAGPVLRGEQLLSTAGRTSRSDGRAMCAGGACFGCSSSRTTASESVTARSWAPSRPRPPLRRCLLRLSQESGVRTREGERKRGRWIDRG